MTGVRLTTRRRLQWAETDAAGHNHFSSAVRWLEEGEHELWCRLGLAELVPCVPRVHVEIDYRERIWFNQQVEVTVGVIGVGRTSCTFGFCVTDLSGEVCVEGRVVVVHAPDSHGKAVPWSDKVRALLESPTALTG
jgi:acyl-CoA thioester hydrolase